MSPNSRPPAASWAKSTSAPDTPPPPCSPAATVPKMTLKMTTPHAVVKERLAGDKRLGRFGHARLFKDRQHRYRVGRGDERPEKECVAVRE